MSWLTDTSPGWLPSFSPPVMLMGVLEIGNAQRAKRALRNGWPPQFARDAQGAELVRWRDAVTACTIAIYDPSESTTETARAAFVIAAIEARLL